MKLLHKSNLEEIKKHDWEIVKYLNDKGEEIGAEDIYMDGYYISTNPENGYINSYIRKNATYHNIFIKQQENI